MKATNSKVKVHNAAKQQSSVQAVALQAESNRVVQPHTVSYSLPKQVHFFR